MNGYEDPLVGLFVLVRPVRFLLSTAISFHSSIRLIEFGSLRVHHPPSSFEFRVFAN